MWNIPLILYTLYFRMRQIRRTIATNMTCSPYWIIYKKNKLSLLLYDMNKIVKWRNCGSIYSFLPIQCLLKPWHRAKCLPSPGHRSFVCFLVFRKRITTHQGHTALPWLCGLFLHCHFVMYPLPDQRIFHAMSP